MRIKALCIQQYFLLPSLLRMLTFSFTMWYQNDSSLQQPVGKFWVYRRHLHSYGLISGVIEELLGTAYMIYGRSGSNIGLTEKIQLMVYYIIETYILNSNYYVLRNSWLGSVVQIRTEWKFSACNSFDLKNLKRASILKKLRHIYVHVTFVGQTADCLSVAMIGVYDYTIAHRSSTTYGHNEIIVSKFSHR